MTKKNQIKSRRKVFKLSAAFFIASLALSACKKETTTIGDGLEEGSLNVSTTDTFTLITYSEYVDSVETDETAVNLLGAYNDPVFGKVDCGIVTQVRLSSNNPELKDSSDAVITVDSVVLSLRYTSINYYGTIQPMTFEVYEVTDDLTRDDKEYYAFNDPTTTGPNLVLAGSETITPDIVSDQIVGGDAYPAHLRIHLDPAFGLDLINATDAGHLADDNAFISYLNGLFIKVNGSALSTGQGTVLYFVLENSISNLTLYYHDEGDDVPEEYSFEFNSSGARYNSINYDWTGTAIAEAVINPDAGKEAFYVQGSAIRGVIEIPYLMDFNYDSAGAWDPKIINKAELVLPVQDFGPDVFHPSSTLLIAKIIDANLSSLTIDVVDGNGSPTVPYNDDDKEYRFIVTREIAGMLNGTRDYKGFRIYSPSFFGSTIERIIFNGSETTLKLKPRLEITYSNY